MNGVLASVLDWKDPNYLCYSDIYVYFRILIKSTWTEITLQKCNKKVETIDENTTGNNNY